MFSLIGHGIEVQARWSRRISSIFSHLQQQEERYYVDKQQEADPHETREGKEGVHTDWDSDEVHMSISEADVSARYDGSEMMDEGEVNDSVSGTLDSDANGHGHDNNVPNADDHGLPHMESELCESIHLSDKYEAANNDRPTNVSHDKDRSMSTTAADRKQGSDLPSSTNELWTDTIMDSLASKGNATIKNSESASDTKDRDGNGHGKNTPTADEDGLHHMDFSAGSLTVIFYSIS